MKAVVSACEKYIPFLIIILVKSVFEHGTGIIVCCGLVLTFLHANSVLKQQVSLYHSFDLYNTENITRLIVSWFYWFQSFLPALR